MRGLEVEKIDLKVRSGFQWKKIFALCLYGARHIFMMTVLKSKLVCDTKFSQ